MGNNKKLFTAFEQSMCSRVPRLSQRYAKSKQGREIVSMRTAVLGDIAEHLTECETIGSNDKAQRDFRSQWELNRAWIWIILDIATESGITPPESLLLENVIAWARENAPK